MRVEVGPCSYFSPALTLNNPTPPLLLPPPPQVKAWCYYESRLLGAHHGLISTYALETLVLYVFNKYHDVMGSPLQVGRARTAGGHKPCGMGRVVWKVLAGCMSVFKVLCGWVGGGGGASVDVWVYARAA
jgi:hypothetical protein